MGAAQIVFLIVSSTVATYVPSSRIPTMIVNAITSMIGMILIWKLDLDNMGGRLTGLVLGCVFAVNIPLSLSLISSNVAGFTKRSVISSLMFVAYCVGNIVGPQFFDSAEEPAYPVSISVHMILQRLVLTRIIDRNQSGHVRTDSQHFLPVLLAGVLYLRESSSG